MQMDALEAIFQRKSVRQFTDQPISEADLNTILTAGMAGPSCVNARDWSFLVVRDPATLARMAAANGKPAEPLKGAALGILVCGDLERAFAGAKEYWIIDGAIAAQNMILAAEALGIGSVWLGTWPQMERVESQRALFSLPETVVPHSLIAFGYATPAQAALPPKPHWEENRVHWEKW
jgi:nitroreductase